ncbi:hypothetical protein [Pseudoalteromonas pernae]|uniref:hypothetical protein n=1 Tax=Pseudoalteromonas pernae TaxID=3118054 RepID=UPI003242E0DA
MTIKATQTTLNLCAQRGVQFYTLFVCLLQALLNWIINTVSKGNTSQLPMGMIYYWSSNRNLATLSHGIITANPTAELDNAQAH